MHARVVLGVGKGVLFREVSSFQERPFHWYSISFLVLVVPSFRHQLLPCNAGV